MMATRIGRFVGIVSLIAIVGSCGIGADDSPRDIRPDLLTSNEPEALSAAVSGSTSRIWMIAPRRQGRETKLRAVGRGAASTTKEMIQLLLQNVTNDERDSRISTAIPRGTEVIDSKLLSNGLCIIDLSTEFLNASGDLLVDAVAQIVFTAAEFDGVVDVRLLIAGEPREWIRGNGTTTAGTLTPYDFPGHNPTSQPDFPAVPAPRPTEPPPAST